MLDGLTEGEHKVDLKTFNLRDISDPLWEAVHKAVSLYRGDRVQGTTGNAMTNGYNLKPIKTVGIIVNREINRIYEKKRTEYRNRGVKVQEVFAYHGTPLVNKDSIIQTNLDPGRTVRQQHGPGCYFSEFPEVSHSYTQDCMFIFKVLLVEGKYNKVRPGGGGYCQMLVLTDNSHFKPEYVLYF